MAVSAEYRAFVEDLFEPIFPVRIRAMFGGAGIYSDDVMFALIADERVYLKADDAGRKAFEAEACGPFVFQPKPGKAAAMSYWEMPERLYDEPDELRVWALRALDVALKSKKPKRGRGRS